MQTPEIHHINTTVSIVSLRNFIRELSVTKKDTIFLHQRDLDAIALQYRNKYDLAFPHLLNEVSIREDLSNKVRVGTIGTIRDFIPEILSTENKMKELMKLYTGAAFAEILYLKMGANLTHRQDVIK